MELIPGTLIKDKRGENRWKITKVISSYPQHTLWQVEDCDSVMNKRLLSMLTLNYQSLPDRDRAMAIGTLRESLLNVAKLLSANYTFLPEPVDILHYSNTDDVMSPQLGEQELALVFAQSNGDIPQFNGNIIRLKDSEKQQSLHSLKSRILIPIIKTLTRLHNEQTIIQAIPLESVINNTITHSPYLTGFTSLVNLNDFVGYNANKIILRPDPLYSAPECFDPKGQLSPATDVYALGKLILQLLLKGKYTQHFTCNNPFPSDIQNLINSLDLPDPWPRFLAMCLQHDPKQRFQNLTEVEIFWKSPAEQEDIREQREQDQQKRQQFEKDKQQANARQRERDQQKRQQFEKDKQQAQARTHNVNQKTTNKAPWHYRENSQLPNAALIIWDEKLSSRGENFQYSTLYRQFSYQYNFSPRLFFQKNYKNKKTNNPFFSMLKDTYALNTIHFEEKDAVATLHRELDPYLKNLKHLIIVGHEEIAAVKSLMEHPDSKNWNIHWIHNTQSNPLTNLQLHHYDLKQLIRTKKK